MADPDPADRARRLREWTPLRTLTDLVHTVADTWFAANENTSILNRLETLMTDTSPLLREVAADMARLGPAIGALVDDNTAKAATIAEQAARIAELTGENTALAAEDTAETSATEEVRTRWGAIAEKFTAAADAPDVDPLP